MANRKRSSILFLARPLPISKRQPIGYPVLRRQGYSERVRYASYICKVPARSGELTTGPRHQLRKPVVSYFQHPCLLVSNGCAAPTGIRRASCWVEPPQSKGESNHLPNFYSLLQLAVHAALRSAQTAHCLFKVPFAIAQAGPLSDLGISGVTTSQYFLVFNRKRAT